MTSLQEQLDVATQEQAVLEVVVKQLSEIYAVQQKRVSDAQSELDKKRNELTQTKERVRRIHGQMLEEASAKAAGEASDQIRAEKNAAEEKLMSVIRGLQEEIKELRSGSNRKDEPAN
jgi:hypothetical protein